ncbi:MAG: ROK family transcriptional regulator [Candidatus Promineofilum sp.]|nr:ROK family transcriptional regulator [Promineifilum sp.]
MIYFVSSFNLLNQPLIFMEKATRQQTRDHNRRLVLRTIFNGGEISRADIARITGLTRPTVSNLVGELLESELVIETGQGPSVGGKRPTLLSIHADGRYLLALDLSGDEFRALLVNLKGEAKFRANLPATETGGEAGLEVIYRLIETVLAETDFPLLGIGVATPGLVDPDNGVILRSVNLGWTDLPLRQLLEARFGYPVYVANDSHMAALAEYTYGDPLDSDNLIVIRVGRGIGAGIILGGHPFYGDGFGAGEIGHVVINPGGDLCSCGNRGCLETTSSIRAILNKARAADRSKSWLAGSEPLTWQRFQAAVAGHDPLATDIAVNAGRYLGVAIAGLVGAFNIRNMILVGRLSDLNGAFLDAVVTETHQRVLPAMAQATNVRFSSLSSHHAADIVMLGCSALILNRELGIA